MSKTKISEYSTTPANNTDIDGVNIAEGCPPSGINNAIRTLMTHVKEWQNGESGDATTFASLNVVNTMSASVVNATTVNATNVLVGGVNILQAIYPVGSIYMNATNSTNPGTLLGFGTWVAFGAGRVPVGFDAGNSNFNAAEKTGGSADAIVVSHTHTGSTGNAGDHSHTQRVNGYDTDTGNGGARGVHAVGSIYPWSSFGIGPASSSASTVNAGTHSHTFTTDSAGSSGTNANLQPYITCYIWKRTA